MGVRSQLEQSRRQIAQLSAQVSEGQAHVRLQVVAAGHIADARHVVASRKIERLMSCRLASSGRRRPLRRSAHLED